MRYFKSKHNSEMPAHRPFKNGAVSWDSIDNIEEVSKCLWNYFFQKSTILMVILEWESKVDSYCNFLRILSYSVFSFTK